MSSNSGCHPSPSPLLFVFNDYCVSFQSAPNGQCKTEWRGMSNFLLTANHLKSSNFVIMDDFPSRLRNKLPKNNGVILLRKIRDPQRITPLHSHMALLLKNGNADLPSRKVRFLCISNVPPREQSRCLRLQQRLRIFASRIAHRIPAPVRPAQAKRR